VIRHPGYAASALHIIPYAFSGTDFAVALLISGLWLYFVSVRIAVEEEMLVEELGKEYIGYRKQVRARLFPFVY
jgi:protein-S-isoprenylcysteine O-methyltransferase Ste14